MLVPYKLSFDEDAEDGEGGGGALGSGLEDALDALVFKMTGVGVSALAAGAWAAHANGDSLVFTPWGALSGLFFTLAVGTNTLALARMPVSLNTGLWGSVSVVTSFMWGVLLLGDELTWPAGAAAGVALLVAGTFGVVSADGGGGGGSNGDDALRQAGEKPVEKEGKFWGMEPSDAPRCLCLSLLSGVWSGAVLVPLSFASVKGTEFVPSLALGAWVSAVALASAACALLPREQPLPGLLAPFPQVSAGWPWAWTDERRRLLRMATCAGFIWTAGDVCTLNAIGMVGFSVVYPVTHTPLISGLWGLLVFGDFDPAPASDGSSVDEEGMELSAASAGGSQAAGEAGRPQFVVAAAAVEADGNVSESSAQAIEEGGDGGDDLSDAAVTFFAAGTAILGGAALLANSVRH